MSYTIEWLRSARKEIDAIPARTAVGIAEAVGLLAEDPRPAGCKMLKGHDDLWRIRIGSYHVIYFIGDAIWLVRIQKVSDRKDAY
jgi:mRNA interferase RelE/StbE